MAKAWNWKPSDRSSGQWNLIDGHGRNRCTVWPNGTWHTWDRHGVGGENSTAMNVRAAMEEATMAVLRQKWAKLSALEG